MHSELVTKDLLSVKILKVQQIVKLGITKSLNIDPIQLSLEDSLNKLSKEINHKANDMDLLIRKIKEKILSSNCNQKIQLLMLVPISSCNKYIKEKFNDTNYNVQISHKLLQKKGILSSPEEKKIRKKERKFLKRLQIKLLNFIVVMKAAGEAL